MTKILYIPSGQFIRFEKANWGIGPDRYTFTFELAYAYKESLSIEDNFFRYLEGCFRSNTDELCDFFEYDQCDNREVNSSMFEIVYD